MNALAEKICETHFKIFTLKILLKSAKFFNKSSLFIPLSDILLAKSVFVLHEHTAFPIDSLYCIKVQLSSHIAKLLLI